MIDLILLAIFSYALYRLALSYNITPWKWIMRYVIVFIASSFAVVAAVVGFYGEGVLKDMAFAEKLGLSLEPFILLYQFVLFFFFRTRIIRYVHALDQIDKNDRDHHLPGPPQPLTNPKDPKDQKDFSYFR